jgi:hypothetical protein
MWGIPAALGYEFIIIFTALQLFKTVPIIFRPYKRVSKGGIE